MYLELPKDFANKKYFIALTISSGDEYAGLQFGDHYVYWRMYNKRLALVLPNVEIRSTGEPESKSSVKRLFTDRVLLDVPIVTMVPRGGPLVDADELFVRDSVSFFGPIFGMGTFGPIRPPMQLSKIVKAKVFSKNVEVAFEVVGRKGQLQTLHYSLSEVPEDGGYRPRKSDLRIGYFSTAYSDLGMYDKDKVKNRYINRWRLEKRDPSLKISPLLPRFVSMSSTRRLFVTAVGSSRESSIGTRPLKRSASPTRSKSITRMRAPGPLWISIPKTSNTISFDGLNNNEGTAIGPSRVNPLTGEILDADIILTDGWIRHFHFQFHDMMPEIATEGMSAETLAWLVDHPNWDPRVRFSAPANNALRPRP